MTDFDSIYDELLSTVEKRIEEICKIGEPAGLYDPVRYIMSAGGKRIRPVLTMLSTGAVGGDPYKAVDIGSAIEIIHNFTLVHDDIMDESALRRGKETIHLKWDEPTAILTGDVMVGLAYKLLPGPEYHSRSGEISSIFTKGLIDVCEGQAYDMMYNNKKDVSRDEYFMMIDKKTARILVTAAVAGAQFGEGTQEQINAIEKYSYNLGIAFQLQDDLLDLTADQDALGKDIGNDIVEGKKTFMIIRAKELAETEADKELMNKFYHDNGLPIEYVPKIIDMFERLGVLNETKIMIDNYLENASEALNIMEDNKWRDMLNFLIKKLSNRNK